MFRWDAIIACIIPEICAFTSRDIERGEVVVEYDGERVEMEEAVRREERYTEEGRPCTLMVIKRARQQVV